MKIYETNHEDLKIFTLVPDGIIHFIKNPKRHCGYGSFLVSRKNKEDNKYHLDRFCFKVDASKIKSIINDAGVEEVKLSYFLNFIDNDLYIDERMKEHCGIVDSITFLDQYLLEHFYMRNVLTLAEISDEITQGEIKYSDYKNKIKEVTRNTKEFCFVKDICKFPFHPFFTDEKEVSLGYFYNPVDKSVIVIKGKLYSRRITVGEYERFREDLEPYELLFMNEEDFDCKKMVENYITTILNAKMKRNEKRRLLRHHFTKLKEYMSMYPYL